MGLPFAMESPRDCLLSCPWEPTSVHVTLIPHVDESSYSHRFIFVMKRLSENIDLDIFGYTRKINQKTKQLYNIENTFCLSLRGPLSYELTCTGPMRPPSFHLVIFRGPCRAPHLNDWLARGPYVAPLFISWFCGAALFIGWFVRGPSFHVRVGPLFSLFREYAKHTSLLALNSFCFLI